LTAKAPHAACRPGRRLRASQTVTSKLRAERAGEPWPRRLGAPLADEALRDGAAVAALFRDHDPGDQVDQDASPAEDREHGERQADQGRVDAEVGRYAGADSGDDTPLTRPVQALAWVDVWLSHSSIMPTAGADCHQEDPDYYPELEPDERSG